MEGVRRESIECSDERLVSVDIRRPMEGSQSVFVCAQAESLERVGSTLPRPVQRVDHHVSDEDDALRRHALLNEIFVCVW